MKEHVFMLTKMKTAISSKKSLLYQINSINWYQPGKLQNNLTAPDVKRNKPSNEELKEIHLLKIPKKRHNRSSGTTLSNAYKLEMLMPGPP